MPTLNFDASQWEPLGDNSPIPEGEYVARITNTAIRTTMAGDQMLEIELEVAQGDYAGRKLWDRMMLTHSNEKAVEFGKRKLATYCHATGVLQLQQTEQLHGKMVTAKVVVVDNGEYGKKNEVKAIKPAQVAAQQQPVTQPAASPAQPAPQATQQHTDASIPPWAK